MWWELWLYKKKNKIRIKKNYIEKQKIMSNQHQHFFRMYLNGLYVY